MSQDLVLRYNALLIDGYKLNDMTKLQVVTTPELAQKAYYHMAAIAEGKQRMVSDLKKLEFLETDCRQGNKCRVRTRERWDFAYLDIITGARSLDVKNYVYEVSYGLENRNGRWLITEISATGEERKDIPSWKQMFGR